MKRTGLRLLTILLTMSILILPSQALSNAYSESSIIHTEYGDLEIEITTIIYDSMSRSNTSKADRTVTAKYDGKVVAKVTLSATFGYDGKMAWVSNTSSSHVTYDGWSYGNEDIASSGGTATLTATLSHLIYRSVLVNISLTCSPTGQIS